jgi:hypothetical protein
MSANYAETVRTVVEWFSVVEWCLPFNKFRLIVAAA